MLTGSGKYLENLVKERLGVKVRSVELNVCQRCSSSMLSKTDQKEAIAAGAYGVKAALNGASGNMVAFERLEGDAYQIDYVLKDVNIICNQEKCVPAAWITEDGSDVTDDFIRYARPLIQGEVTVDYVLKDVNIICNQEKCVPAAWITEDGSDVTDDFIRYARPLIQGEVTVPTENGVPKFAYRK